MCVACSRGVSHTQVDGGAAFQTPRCGASISAQADGIDEALLRGTIATSSSSRRGGGVGGGGDAAAASTTAVVGPNGERESEKEEPPAVSLPYKAGIRSLAATPTNGVVAVPLDARRRRRRLRARSRRSAPLRADTTRHGRASSRHTLTAVEGSREAARRAWCCLVAGRVLESFATTAWPVGSRRVIPQSVERKSHGSARARVHGDGSALLFRDSRTERKCEEIYEIDR